MCVRGREGESKCVCEREGENKCVCEREGERASVCACLCVKFCAMMFKCCTCILYCSTIYFYSIIYCTFTFCDCFQLHDVIWSSSVSRWVWQKLRLGERRRM